MNRKEAQKTANSNWKNKKQTKNTGVPQKHELEFDEVISILLGVKPPEK